MSKDFETHKDVRVGLSGGVVCDVSEPSRSIIMERGGSGASWSCIFA